MTVALRPATIARPADAAGVSLAPMPLHDARVLTASGQQARILLDGQVYLLRITRAGKLILTK